MIGDRTWTVEVGDCLDILRTIPDRSVSLVATSPPYEAARLYGIGYKLTGQQWVDWMIPRIVECCRVSTGLVIVNAAGQVRDAKYSPVVEWLVADLTRHHGIVCGPAPYVYFRFGIPGSGGKHYHRRDWEPCYAFCLPDRLPLAWSANTAMGHPPKWAPGGKMSNRLTNGQRISYPHACSDSLSEEYVDPSQGNLFGEVDELPHEGPTTNQWGGHETSGGTTRADGTKQQPGRPSHQKCKPVTNRSSSGERKEGSYDPPAIANPGNVIRETYDAEQVRQLFEAAVSGRIDQGDVVRCLVGGGLMGHPLATENEAPFSARLVEFFVRSYCPPAGIVLDPFCGGGTTVDVAVAWGRRAIGIDVRQSQADLTRRRLASVTSAIPGMEV